jgi:hypothetical protein
MNDTALAIKLLLEINYKEQALRLRQLERGGSACFFFEYRGC